MKREGAPSGEKHPRATLTDEQVKAMRERHIPYVIGYETLAAEFGCGISTARDIVNYKTRIDA